MSTSTPGGSRVVRAASLMFALAGVLLSGRVPATEPAFSVQTHRDFYVGHTFYANHTFAERVAGFGSGAAHAIGRKMLIGEVVRLFESIRAEMRTRTG